PLLDVPASLVWQPRCSLTSSSLVRTISGRIVYRDPPAPPKKLTARERELQRIQQMQQARPAPPAGVVGAVLRVLSSGGPQALPKTGSDATLYLLGGDRLPCKVSEIDEEGVHFTSEVVNATFVPHANVKAIEFIPNTTASALEEAERERLLTLPRM